jgi:hypothetical protein
MSEQPGLSLVTEDADWQDKFNRASGDYRCAVSMSRVKAQMGCKDKGWENRVKQHALEMRDAFLSQFSSEGALDHWLDECSRGLRPVLLWVPDHDQAKFHEAAQTYCSQAGITSAREDQAVTRIEAHVQQLPKAAALSAVERALARLRNRPVPAVPPALKIVAEPSCGTDNAG